MAMRFLTDDVSVAVQQLAADLAAGLASGQRLLWLLSGGSNVGPAVQVMRALPSELTGRLAVALIDERYGPVGHPESNMQKLVVAGFSPKAAHVYPVLQAGLDMVATTAAYAQTIGGLLGQADTVIGQLGIGADGHTAGLLPGSAALQSDQLAASFIADDFARITLAPKALLQINQAFVLAYGADKTAQLTRLRDQIVPPNQQPAQILRQIARVDIYNDNVEGDAI